MRARPSVNRTLVNACNQLINDDLPHVVCSLLGPSPPRRTSRCDSTMAVDLHPPHLRRSLCSAFGKLRHKLRAEPDQYTRAERGTNKRGTTSAAPTAACADVAALKSSLEALTKVKPAEDGLLALTTAIANVKTNLDKAQTSASPALQPSVQQVKTALPSCRQQQAA